MTFPPGLRHTRCQDITTRRREGTHTQRPRKLWVFKSARRALFLHRRGGYSRTSFHGAPKVGQQSTRRRHDTALRSAWQESCVIGDQKVGPSRKVRGFCVEISECFVVSVVIPGVTQQQHQEIKRCMLPLLQKAPYFRVYSSSTIRRTAAIVVTAVAPAVHL